MPGDLPLLRVRLAGVSIRRAHCEAMSRLATPLSVLAIAGASIALVACGSSGDDSSAGASASTNPSAGDNTQNAAFESTASA